MRTENTPGLESSGLLESPARSAGIAPGSAVRSVLRVENERPAPLLDDGPDAGRAERMNPLSSQGT